MMQRDTIQDLQFDTEITPVARAHASRYDVETLARLAISCSLTHESSEAIEWIWAAIRRAESLGITVAELLTGTLQPDPKDYGKAGRKLADGRKAIWSTALPTSHAHRKLAGHCLTGAIADPLPFWNFCRRHKLTDQQTKNLARYASQRTGQEREAGLQDCAYQYGLPLADTLRLRVWW